MASETPNDRGELWRALKKAEEAGVPLPLDDKPFVNWTVTELQVLYENTFGEPEEYTGNAYTEAHAPQHQPTPLSPALEAMDAGYPAQAQAQSGAQAATHSAECESSTVCGMVKHHPLEWAQYRPSDLAMLLGVPFSDQGEKRAGLTMNTHGPDDPLRVDSLGRVWYRDEVIKPAIPQPRMVRKTKSVSNDVKVVATKRPNGGLDETFEIAGQNKFEVTITTSLPASQVGIYRDPRMPFKIHQYNGRRGFDYEAIRDYYGGLDLIPTVLKEKGTIYIDADLCFDINKVRDAIEREYREKALGRSTYGEY